jgi:hypothetical protein
MNDKIQDESIAYFYYYNEFNKTSANNKLIVKEDEHGELYIDLPNDLMREMGWDETTELVWTVADNGTIGLRKRIDDSSNEA